MTVTTTALRGRISRVSSSLSDDELHALTEAATAVILDGGAFHWLRPPERHVLEQYLKGLLLVPERELFVARMEDGTICGGALLAYPPFHSELHNPKIRLATLFIAPYARRQGLGRALAEMLLERAHTRGAKVIDCEVRETQHTAIRLLVSLGFRHWGTHPYYTRIGGQIVRGLYFSKLLVPDHKTTCWQTDDRPFSTPAVDNVPFIQPGLTLYPAIDLKGGHCVRLRQGEMNHATQYSDNPAAQAKVFADAGCRYLHVVDLDGAFAGQSSNIAAVEQVIASTSLPVQLGGGLRDMRAIERWLEAGVSRVILGSVAVKDPELVRQAARAWPGRIVAGIDARMGRVATEGWAEISELDAIDLARKMEDAGVAAIIFTEITRDGMLEGLDLEQTAQLARHVSVPIIASGGVGTLDHLRALRHMARDIPGISGVIVGRALYDGRIALKDALDIIEGKTTTTKEGSPC